MVKLNKIYTRTGDDGTTGLVDGSRLPKSASRMAAIGDVDEANSAIGLAIVALTNPVIAALTDPVRPEPVEGYFSASETNADRATGFDTLSPNGTLVQLLQGIQNDLFDLGADLATPGDDFTPGEMTLRIVAAQVTRLESAIDAANETLEPLRSFILPGGTPAAAALHLARAISRRAERSAVAAAQDVSLNPQALQYLNRLSDLLFVLCRSVNLSAGGDVLWKPGASR